MTRYVFYTTAGCHLCELAWEMIVAEQLQPGFTLVEISDDERLVERYGIRIPVLRDLHGNELGWPFDAAALRAFVDPQHVTGAQA